jgi:hypothetical protein
MASTDLVRDAVDAASDQRYPGTSAQPARFALVLDALDDPVARAQAIAGVLGPIGATIEPLSTLDRGVLVAAFPDRTFAGPNGAAFAAAHRFQGVFDLEAAEPDLPTDLFPDDIVPDEFVEEDAEGFPAECWAPAEASLPAWAITSITAPEAWTFSQASSGQGQGTSSAVALAAGTAALWLSHHGRANLIRAARARGETLPDMFRRVAGATARRPSGWDSFSMSSGIVDAHALLSATDFDLDRDRESAAAPAGLRESAALGVASLAAEEIGPAAAIQDPPDWYRHSPELSWLLLQGRRDLRPDGVLVRTTPDDQRVPSRDLDNAVSNPVLRDAVGLGGAATEGGTGVGTGVEGGGR